MNLQNKINIDENQMEGEKLMENVKKPKRVRKVGFKVGIILMAVVLAIAILIVTSISTSRSTFSFFNVYIPSDSMAPTITKGDRLIVERIHNTDDIKRDDIVIFYSDELKETIIKRVIGLPGDHIVIHNGIVNINGNDIQEDYINKDNKYNGKFDVPEGKFFLLGDNRPTSSDSRYWLNHYIGKESIKGKVAFRFYPFNKFGSI